MNTNKIVSILLFIFCIVGAIWGITRQNSLKKNHRLGVGTAISFRAGGRGNAGSILISYSLAVEGKEYHGSTSYQTTEISPYNVQVHLLNKTFPVAYNPSNPSISTLLVTPKDFSRFGYPFPDTLAWVLQYFKEK